MSRTNRTPAAEPIIGEKKLSEWDREWIRIEGGFRVRHDDLFGKPGLWRAILKGRVVAIGTGVESGCRALGKRVFDFVRPSPSGRNHKVGRLIHEHRDVLTLEVLLTGSGPEARSIAEALKGPLQELHNPAWPVPAEIVELAVERRKAETRARRAAKAKVAN